MAGQKGRSGGARQGAGRPRIQKSVSDKAIARWEKAARKLKRETGEDIEYHALKCIVDKDEALSLRVAALKAYTEALIVKKTENKSDVQVTKTQGPAVMLPPIKPVEAEIVTLKKKA